MSGISPPAGAKQNAVVLESIVSPILDTDDFRSLAPELTVALGFSY